MKISKQAQELAARCSDAYSADQYQSWPAVAHMLLGRGYSERETEAIMRSKITRWARDNAEHNRPLHSSQDVARYLDRFPESPEKLAELVRNTFTHSSL